MQNLEMRAFENCTLQQKMALRDIRNQANIRKFLYTDHLIGEAEHKAWLDYVAKDRSRIIFVPLVEGEVAGLVAVTQFDTAQNTAYWTYYLGGKFRGGLGSVVEYCFLNYVFNTLKIEKLNAEVIEGNEAVIEKHIRFGFQKEGFLRSSIIKQGQRIGVHLVGITREDWAVDRQRVFEERRNIFDNFKVNLV